MSSPEQGEAIGSCSVIFPKKTLLPRRKLFFPGEPLCVSGCLLLSGEIQQSHSPELWQQLQSTLCCFPKPSELLSKDIFDS